MRYFSGRLWLAPLLGAAVLPAVVVLLGGKRGWTSAGIVATGVLLLLPYIVYTLYAGSTRFGLPSGATIRSVWDALGDGWTGLLTYGLPAPPNATLLVPLEVVTWAVGLTGAMLVARGAGLLTPVFPAFLGFVAAVALTATRSGSALILTAVFVLVAGSQAFVRANAEEGASRRVPAYRRADRGGLAARNDLRVGVAAAVAAAVIAAGAVGAYASTHPPRRLDPRAWVHPPSVVITGVNPLAQVEAQLSAKPIRHLFTVTLQVFGAQAAPVDHIRLLGLDGFDGSLWKPVDGFEPVGSTLPASPSVATRSLPRVLERVEVSELPEPFVPTPGQPISGAGPSIAFDPLEGDLLVTNSRTAAFTYSGWSVVDAPSDALLGATPAYHGSGAAELTELPADIPPGVTALATSLGNTSTTAVGKARSIERFLQTNFSYQENGPPGSSIATLQQFLLDSHRGQEEQFAAAFALLARAIGLPARVAVGYRLRDPVGPSVYNVTTADAYAWPEVDFSRYGWVAFDPLDPHRQAPLSTTPPQAPGSVRITTPTTKPVVARPKTQPRLAVGPLDSRRAVGDGDISTPLLVGLMGGLLIFAIGLCAAGIVLAKTVRRRRRARAPTPSQRVFGAWNETCDHLVARGVRIDDSHTPAEAIERAIPRVGVNAAPVLEAMQSIVTAATYSQSGPDSSTAERAWLLEAQARELIDRDTGFPTRCLASLDPRTLLPRRPRTRPPRQLIP
jgi:hypothetical protein